MKRQYSSPVVWASALAVMWCGCVSNNNNNNTQLISCHIWTDRPIVKTVTAVDGSAPSVHLSLHTGRSIGTVMCCLQMAWANTHYVIAFANRQCYLLCQWLSIRRYAAAGVWPPTQSVLPHPLPPTSTPPLSSPECRDQLLLQLLLATHCSRLSDTVGSIK